MKYVLSFLFMFLTIYSLGYAMSDTLVITLNNDQVDEILISELKKVEFKGIIEINMPSGWNTISSYIIPDLPSMADVWREFNSLVVIKNNSGAFYFPSMEINTIGDWNNLEGYQAYILSPTDFFVTGTQINPQTIISLSQGWNIIPYLKETEMAVETALSSLGSSFIIVKDNDGNIYFPLFGINFIGNMKPGQGYQIYMSETDTLVYPE